MEEKTDRKMYGVWIPRQGWLRGADVFADYDIEIAHQVARLIGKSAKVRYIDKSIVELERLYLEQETRSLWHIFKTYLERKNNN